MYTRMYGWRQLAKTWYAIDSKKHNFNPTKCTTISKYSMNVDDEAEVDRILAQADILVPYASPELSGFPQPTYYNMRRRDSTLRGKQRLSADGRGLLAGVPPWFTHGEKFRMTKILSQINFHVFNFCRRVERRKYFDAENFQICRIYIYLMHDEQWVTWLPRVCSHELLESSVTQLPSSVYT